MKSLVLDNLRFRYEEVGQGPLVVLLHGFGGHPQDWKEIIAQLSQNHRVVVPHLSSFFTSEIPQTFSQQVRILCKFIKLVNQQEEPFHIVGTSYGGALSWGIRSKIPNLIHSHTLINPMPLNPLKHIHDSFIRMTMLASKLPLGLELLFKTRLGTKTLRQMAQIFHMGIVGKGKIQKFNSRKMKLIYSALRRFAWIARSEDWSLWASPTKDYIPTLLVYGRKDKLFRVKSFQLYANYIKNCEVLDVEHLGHLLVRHRPKLVAELVSKMVKQSNSYNYEAIRTSKIEEQKNKLNRSHKKVS